MEDATITQLKHLARAESLRIAKSLYGDNYSSQSIGKSFGGNQTPEAIITKADKFYEYLVKDLPK